MTDTSMTQMNTSGPAEVISRTESTTTVHTNRPATRTLVETTTTTRGIQGVVGARDLMTAFRNAIPFADREVGDHNCLRLEVRDRALIVVAAAQFVLTKQELPLVVAGTDEDNEAYSPRDGSAAIGLHEAKYLVDMLRRRLQWCSPQLAFSAIDIQTTTRWLDEQEAQPEGEHSEPPLRLSHALTVELLKGTHPLRTELPSYGPVTPLRYRQLLTHHVPAPAEVVAMDPALLARFAKVAEAPLGSGATRMTVTTAEPGKPIRVTIGSRFEAIVAQLAPRNITEQRRAA